MTAPLRELGDWWTLRALPAQRGDRVYEVGAGEGRLIRRLRARGVDAHGSDPFAELPPGAPVERASADGLELEPASLDLIVMWHVLEHLAAPEAAIRAVRPALRPGGRLVTAVPNLGSLQALIGGDRWFHQDVPRHAVHFTREGLVRLLERCGLDVLRIRTLALDQNLLGMTQTLLNRLTRRRDVGFSLLKGVERPLPGDVAVTVMALAPAVALGAIAELGAATVGRGGSLVVEARLS